MGKNNLIVVFLLILLLVPKEVLASKEAGASASISPSVVKKDAPNSELKSYTETAIKRRVIYEILSRNNSPLVEEVDAFIDVCTKYDIDCYLLPSITGLESGFGRMVKSGTYNPFGWGGGVLTFASWADCIEAVGKGLKENYINKGADTVEKIGPIYAASPTWAVRINSFHAQFTSLEEEKRLYFSKLPLK